MKNFILLLVVFLLFGCARSVGNPYADAANNLIKTKQTISAAATAISILCMQEETLIPENTCEEVNDIYYNKLPQTYKLASDALVYAVSVQDINQFYNKQGELLNLMNTLNKVLVTYQKEVK